MKNVSTDEILDLTGYGINDIKNGIIRTTSDPEFIFGEDPLRMMRIIRFSVKYNFKIDYSFGFFIKGNLNFQLGRKKY